MPCQVALENVLWLRFYQSTRCPLKLRIIQTFDRQQIERQFFSRQPYAILSIRRPGSRFASELVTANRVARCDLMLHEWNVDAPPYPLPPVVLSSRQALKIADFVSQQRQDASQLIIQSEFSSSQLAAIVETIGDWTGVFVDRPRDWPIVHEPTRALLEMAMDSLELASCDDLDFMDRQDNEQSEVLRLLELIVSLTNVSLIASNRTDNCFSLTPEQACGIDTALGVSLDPDSIGYHPPYYKDYIFGAEADLRTMLTSPHRRVCRQGGCQVCLNSLRHWQSPVCLSLIFDPRHLPPTLVRVHQAGGTWAIITNRKMIRPIIRLAGEDATIEITSPRGSDLVLLTFGPSEACEALREIYRWI